MRRVKYAIFKVHFIRKDTFQISFLTYQFTPLSILFTTFFGKNKKLSYHIDNIFHDTTKEVLLDEYSLLLQCTHNHTTIHKKNASEASRGSQPRADLISTGEERFSVSWGSFAQAGEQRFRGGNKNYRHGDVPTQRTKPRITETTTQSR